MHLIVMAMELVSTAARWCWKWWFFFVISSPGAGDKLSISAYRDMHATSMMTRKIFLMIWAVVASAWTNWPAFFFTFDERCLRLIYISSTFDSQQLNTMFSSSCIGNKQEFPPVSVSTSLSSFNMIKMSLILKVSEGEHWAHHLKFKTQLTLFLCVSWRYPWCIDVNLSSFFYYSLNAQFHKWMLLCDVIIG